MLDFNMSISVDETVVTCVTGDLVRLGGCVQVLAMERDIGNEFI